VSAAGQEGGGILSSLRSGLGTVADYGAKGLGVIGSGLAGWTIGTGINEMVSGHDEHHVGVGAVDVAEGGANLGLTLLSQAPKVLPFDAAAGAGSLPAWAGTLGSVGAGIAAGGGIALAGATAKAAIQGEETPVEVAEKYWSQKLGQDIPVSSALADDAQTALSGLGMIGDLVHGDTAGIMARYNMLLQENKLARNLDKLVNGFIE
jgi:hypothetical protein